MVMPAINPDGSALCEWLVPLEDKIGKGGKIAEKGLLSIKKDLGSIIFALQYLNNTDLLREGNIFKYEWIQYYDDLAFDDGKIFVRRGSFRTEIKKVILGCDLAISKKDSADYTVITAVGQGEDLKLYVLDVTSGRLSFQQQKTTIRAMVDRWNPVQTIVESVAYQAVMIEELRSEGGLKIVPYKTVTDKVSRAMGISGHFENSNIFFRKNVMMDHIDSLLLFPDAAHDDFVDSLGFSISGFKTAASEMVVISI
jgi:predicted phage terminase large subunit-like protein